MLCWARTVLRRDYFGNNRKDLVPWCLPGWNLPVRRHCLYWRLSEWRSTMQWLAAKNTQYCFVYIVHCYIVLFWFYKGVLLNKTTTKQYILFFHMLGFCSERGSSLALLSIWDINTINVEPCWGPTMDRRTKLKNCIALDGGQALCLTNQMSDLGSFASNLDWKNWPFFFKI